MTLLCQGSLRRTGTLRNQFKDFIFDGKVNTAMGGGDSEPSVWVIPRGTSAGATRGRAPGSDPASGALAVGVWEIFLLVVG